MKFVHISDLHFVDNWPEGQGVVLREFFSDLQTNVIIDDETYLVFSGDIFGSTPDTNALKQLKAEFCDKLDKIGIGSEKRIFAPGSSGDYLVKAMPQFGLSCLGHYIALTNWRRGKGELVLCIDSAEMPNHEKGIVEYCQIECVKHHLAIVDLKRVVIDNWSGEKASEIRQINSLRAALPGVSITVLVTIQDPANLGDSIKSKLKSDFSEFYLWSLKRPQIRQLVQKYIENGSRLDENQAVSKIAEHLEAINLPRTTLNCVLLLKVFEHHVDISPVNRTELMEQFLFYLFANIQQIPRYSTLPDMKDCLYALGNFSESILRNNKFQFTRRDFTTSIQEYCDNQLMQLDIDVLFNGLLDSNLLTGNGQMYSFRFVQWIYFFAAQRMRHNREFYNFMMKDGEYSRFPEMIEFFAGIDRRRNELIETLVFDLGKLNDEFEVRTQIPEEFDPYAVLKWHPKDDSVIELREYIGENAQRTELPGEVKDSIADQSYDPTKSYRQIIREFVDESSLRKSIEVMQVAALALRNSDHADLGPRKDLLQQVVVTWSRILQVSVFLSPILADKGEGSFEGFGLYLGKSFDELEQKKRWLPVLTALPHHVVKFYERDLFSHKMGPLLSNYLSENPSEIAKFLMCGLLVKERPANWEIELARYVQGLDKNSFYIYSILTELRDVYEVDFCTSEDRKSLRSLIGTIVARHETQVKAPNKKLIEKAAKAALDDESKESV